MRLQNIHNKWVASKFSCINELAPDGVRGLLVLIYIFIIAVGVELTCQLDLVLFVEFSWFWGLTCDFWAENAKEKIKAKAKAMKSVTSPCGLRSSLRQSGSAFRAGLYGTRERVPFRGKSLRHM
jgi:hypothetical protein